MAAWKFLYSVRWLFNLLYSKYNSKKTLSSSLTLSVNCNDHIRKSNLLLFTLLKNPDFQHEPCIILKSFNCSNFFCIRIHNIFFCGVLILSYFSSLVTQCQKFRCKIFTCTYKFNTYYKRIHCLPTYTHALH